MNCPFLVPAGHVIGCRAEARAWRAHYGAENLDARTLEILDENESRLCDTCRADADATPNRYPIPGDRVRRTSGPAAILGTVLSVHLTGTCDRCLGWGPHAIVRWDDGPQMRNGERCDDFDESPADLTIVEATQAIPEVLPCG